jgi:hypothetical protein
VLEVVMEIEAHGFGVKDVKIFGRQGWIGVDAGPELDGDEGKEYATIEMVWRSMVYKGCEIRWAFRREADHA